MRWRAVPFSLFASFFFLGMFLASLRVGAETAICDHVFVKDGAVDLNDNEKIMVCGSNRGDEGWATIPLPQAQLHLNSILQNFGYSQPRFERSGDILNVWIGSRTLTKTFTVEGAGGVLDASRKRKIIGEPLVPEKLNEIESWANLKTRSQGYACPIYNLQAHAWDGTVLLKADLGTVEKIGNVDYGDLEGLSMDVMSRYQPFQVGDIYDVRETQIMAARLLADGLFQSAYFVIRCQEDVANLEMHTSIGKPRIVRFGIGASTEEFPFFDLSFRNARLDDKASSITASLHASPRKQRLDLSSELYWFPGWHRIFWGPRASLSRESESSFETNTAKAGVDLGRNWDFRDVRFLVRWGPTYNFVRTIRGVGPENAGYPTFDGSLNFMSHSYESSIRDQYEGWSGNLFYRGQNQGLGSKVDVNRYEFRFKHLWNLGEYSPPFLVLGTRVEGTVVDANSTDDLVARQLLPIEDRVFAGGDQDLRGFARQSINNRGLGYLTFLYFGLELRLIEELPYHLQPFVLWDIGKAGNQRYQVDPPIFVSEGVGLRWASPFGTLRGSIAKGRIVNEDEATDFYEQNWIYFFSFGQEF